MVRNERKEQLTSRKSGARPLSSFFFNTTHTVGKKLLSGGEETGPDGTEKAPSVHCRLQDPRAFATLPCG